MHRKQPLTPSAYTCSETRTTSTSIANAVTHGQQPCKSDIMRPNTATQPATDTHLPHAVSLSRMRDPKHAPPMMPGLPEQAFPSASSTAHAGRWAGGLLGIGSGLRLTGAHRGRPAHSGRGCSSRRRAMASRSRAGAETWRPKMLDRQPAGLRGSEIKSSSRPRGSSLSKFRATIFIR